MVEALFFTGVGLYLGWFIWETPPRWACSLQFWGVEATKRLGRVVSDAARGK